MTVPQLDRTRRARRAEGARVERDFRLRRGGGRDAVRVAARRRRPPCLRSRSIRARTWSRSLIRAARRASAKGVMLTHHNLVANLLADSGAAYHELDDTLICVLPMFHIYGMVAIMNLGLYCGRDDRHACRASSWKNVSRLMQDSPRHVGAPRAAHRARAREEPARRAIRSLASQDHLLRRCAARRRADARVLRSVWAAHHTGLRHDGDEPRARTSLALKRADQAGSVGMCRAEHGVQARRARRRARSWAPGSGARSGCAGRR